MNTESRAAPSLLEEKTDILFREIELATRWERPSILFAIYRSTSVRDRVMADLGNRLTAIGQKVHLLPLSDEDQIDTLEDFGKLPELSQTILFLDGYKHEVDQNGARTFEQINKYREYFIDNSLRAVFWLFEQDVKKFAARATECWYLRHRVVDFTDEIKPAQLFLNTLESCMQAQVAGTAQCQDPEKLQQEIESLSDELALKPSHATVLFILGLLWSRKNDPQNALKFLHAALDISNTTGDVKLQGRCLEALAAVEAGLGNAPEAISLYKQAIPLSSKPGLIWKNVGLLLSNTREHQQTMDAFLNALRTSPQDLPSWIHLGDAYLNLGLLEKAGSAFETALELSPSSDLAWTGLGKTRLQLGETDRAVTALQEAVRSNPQNASAWVCLGQCYLDQKREPDAILAFQKAADTEPGNAVAWNQLGLLYLKQKKYDRAMDVLHKVVDLQPESGEVYKNLGIAEYHCGNFSRAAYHFEQAIPLFDDRAARSFLWKCLAETYRRLKNEPMAVSALKQAAQLAQPLPSPVRKPPLSNTAEQEHSPQEIGGPSMIESTHTFESRSAKDWSDLGNSFLKVGAYKKAVFAYTKAIEMAPENSWPYIKNLAVANYQMGKRLGKRLSDQPEDPGLLETEVEEDEEEQEISFSIADNVPLPQRSDLSPGSNQQDPALAPESGSAVPPPMPADLPQAVVSPQEASPSAEDWNEWGNNYAATGDFEKAIEAYKKSIQVNPQYGQPYSNLGFLYFKKGDYRLAAILYQKGIELLPTLDDKAATLNRLGDTLHRLHKYEDAFIAYKKARELAPSANPILDRARISILQNSIG